MSDLKACRQNLEHSPATRVIAMYCALFRMSMHLVSCETKTPMISVLEREFSREHLLSDSISLLQNSEVCE